MAAMKFQAPQLGNHRHQCPNCNVVWEHPDEMAGDEEAHTCPNPECKALAEECWFKYWGPKMPDLSHLPKVAA